MLTAIGDVMRKAYEKGWITTRDGNISLRRKGKDFMYITPSGWRKTIIHPEHIIKVKFTPSGFNLSESKGNPSGELSMHGYLQRYHDTTRAVVHLHPTHIVSAIYAGWDLQEIAKQFPEVSRYTKVGPTVPVLPATSWELANKTFEAMKEEDSNKIKYDIVGQSNHGVCAVGPNPWDAFEHIERLEHICEIVLKSGVRPKKEKLECKFQRPL